MPVLKTLNATTALGSHFTRLGPFVVWAESTGTIGRRRETWGALYPTDLAGKSQTWLLSFLEHFRSFPVHSAVFGNGTKGLEWRELNRHRGEDLLCAPLKIIPTLQTRLPIFLTNMGRYAKRTGGPLEKRAMCTIRETCKSSAPLTSSFRISLCCNRFFFVILWVDAIPRLI